MQIKFLGFWILGFLQIVNASGQRIVDQWSVEPNDSVFLFDTMSIEGFQPPLGVGSVFPDFQTVTTENEVLTRDLIFSECIAESKVPIFVFGRPSCNFMRAAYKELILPMQIEIGPSVNIFHIANSIEAHSTNGYPSPYYTIQDGITYSGNIIVPDNIGFEFDQPFTGEEFVALSSAFVDKVVETGVGEMNDFDEITILLDDLAGGFTQRFAGPSIVWVLDPHTNGVVYERTDFSCYTGEGSIPCQSEFNEFINAIENVRNGFNPVGIDEIDNNNWIGLEGINLLGQESDGYLLEYNKKTKQKRIKPAQ